MAESSSLRGERCYGTFLTLRLTCVVLFAEKIQSLLKTTTGLIDICYECSGMGYTLADESIDLEQVSDQLVELLSVLKELFKAVKANTPDSLDIGVSVDVVLSRCKDEISEVDVMLKRKSGRKRIEGSFDSPVNLTNLASSITTLRKVVEGYFRCVWTFAKKSGADNIHKGPLP